MHYLYLVKLAFSRSLNSHCGPRHPAWPLTPQRGVFEFAESGGKQIHLEGTREGIAGGPNPGASRLGLYKVTPISPVLGQQGDFSYNFPLFSHLESQGQDSISSKVPCVAKRELVEGLL